MTSKERFIDLQEGMKALANPEQAQKMAAYMKNHFVFYGIPANLRRLIYKEIIKEDKKAQIIDWQLLDLAWASPKREMHYFVCDYLKAMQKWLSFDHVPKLLAYASSNEWWDTIDHFDHVFGNIADSRLDELMLTFSQSDDFWIRRMAIDHQLGKKEKTNPDLLSAIILNNLGTTEFFINKAIGSSLRDYSKTNPKWVRAFLRQHQEKLAPLSIREATKYL
ncbi:DNA alkylation repair enzyme [Streptococcus pseudoporcinus]|uniref:DNA alkylation repair enzyme n=1 Tax=Streptococcus pseudoporcinus TaxID=361101 RepID=A0A4U9Z8R4_9STRE|nr:DNA alkylation repair protein [Streptococcus pseudoporcinus]VTS36338.1 DNA alkylation repair enzyme [Streptococcus pseudoporcinus]